MSWTCRPDVPRIGIVDPLRSSEFAPSGTDAGTTTTVEFGLDMAHASRLRPASGAKPYFREQRLGGEVTRGAPSALPDDKTGVK